MRKSILLGAKSEESAKEVANKRTYEKELANVERIIKAKEEEIAIAKEELTDRFYLDTPISEAEILTLYGEAIYSKQRELAMLKTFKGEYYTDK